MPNAKSNHLLNAILISITLLTNLSCSTNANESEWISLFNGEHFDNWTVKLHHHEVGDNYAQTFRVVNGNLQVNYDDYGKFENRYGHLFYNQSYTSYHFSLEYRFTDQWMEDAPNYTYRNSGIMFHSQDPKTILKEQDWPISVELQLLAGLEDGKPRPTGNMCSPGTEVIFEGEMDPRHCIDSSSDTFEWDQWVKADLIVFGDSLVLHLINGDTVLRYSHPQIGGGVANNYDPAFKQDGKILNEGFIALQAEGQGIEFREIKIRKLK